MTTCTVSVSRGLQEILDATPQDKIAMFRVNSISSKIEDWICGESVYVSRKGNVYDFMTDQNQGPVSEFSLHFVSYINRS